MDELREGIEKLVKAGIGAVQEGLNASADAVEEFAKKGEPAFNQAKQAFSETASKIAESFKGLFDDEGIDDIKPALTALGREKLQELRDYIDGLLKDMDDQECCGEEEKKDCCCGEEKKEEKPEE